MFPVRVLLLQTESSDPPFFFLYRRRRNERESSERDLLPSVVRHPCEFVGRYILLHLLDGCRSQLKGWYVYPVELFT